MGLPDRAGTHPSPVLVLVEKKIMQKYSTPAIVPGGGKDALSIETLPDTLFGSVDVYLASEVDTRIAEMRKAFETSSTDEENRLRARVADLEKSLRTYFTLSEELSRLIDDDKDVRALKLALAMAGHRPKYRAEIDEARNALMESQS